LDDDGLGDLKEPDGREPVESWVRHWPRWTFGSLGWAPVRTRSVRRCWRTGFPRTTCIIVSAEGSMSRWSPSWQT